MYPEDALREQWQLRPGQGPLRCGFDEKVEIESNAIAIQLSALIDIFFSSVEYVIILPS